jgi:hypothetical protein
MSAELKDFLEGLMFLLTIPIGMLVLFALVFFLLHLSRRIEEKRFNRLCGQIENDLELLEKISRGL